MGLIEAMDPDFTGANDAFIHIKFSNFGRFDSAPFVSPFVLRVESNFYGLFNFR